MIAVIFEVWPAEGRAQEYFDIAASLRDCGMNERAQAPADSKAVHV